VTGFDAAIKKNTSAYAGTAQAAPVSGNFGQSFLPRVLTMFYAPSRFRPARESL
jgi:hypothetical protein